MDMAAQTLRKSALAGFKRFRNFRAARHLFIRAYAGQYYNQSHGVVGQEPLNMAFTAIRALVPNIVTRNPEVVVSSDYLMYREYADLLALSLNYMSKKIKLPDILQRGLVDAIFTLGIFKVGLGTTDSLVYFGEEGVDPGQLYVDTVDFDNFTCDPMAKQFKSAAFIGERIRVERNEIMDSGLYDNSIIEKLPPSADAHYQTQDQKLTRHLSHDWTARSAQDKLHDSIDLLELWIPGANVLVTLPYKNSGGERFLREEDYFGPDDGPYSFLSLTPAVPDNPIPVQLAGIWQDLHTIGNRIAKKTLDQAEAQKDVLGFQRQYADDAQELVDANNLDAVAMQDPNAAKMFSFGGQNPLNERMTAQLLQWFDQFSGNTSMLGGSGVSTDVATVANIMNQNTATGVTYMRDRLYGTTQDIMRKCAWYMHTDELIRMPLIQRETIPAQYNISAEGVQMTAPARVEETQVFLTPGVRRGDSLDFAFDIEQDSMAPVNWQVRLQQLDALTIKIIPAAAQAAQICAQMGVPFSFERLITRVAKMMNIDWIDEIFQSPELIAQMAAAAQAGPQPPGQDGAASSGAIRQNGGAVTQSTPPDAGVRQRQEAQAGAAQGQADLPIREI